MRMVVMAGLLALSGCGLFNRDAPGGRESGGAPLTDQQFCQRQAENAPAVKELIIKGIGNPHFALEQQDQMKAAKQDATLSCLRSRGVVAPGGVERQKPL